MKKNLLYFLIIISFLGLYNFLNKNYFSANVLGECTTTLNNRSYEQINNIKNAVKRLNNIRLDKGDKFSFNLYIGRCKNEHGFEPAPMIVDGKIEESIGGGICQVSSTLYNAVLISGLEVIERHAHSYRINSVPPGFDATVAYGKADLVFENNYSFPVFISSRYSRNRITIRISSSKQPPYKVKIERIVKKLIEPPYEKPEKSSYPKAQFIDYSKGLKGAVVEVRRLFYKNGNFFKEEVVSTDIYRFREKIL